MIVGLTGDFFFTECTFLKGFNELLFCIKNKIKDLLLKKRKKIKIINLFLFLFDDFTIIFFY